MVANYTYYRYESLACRVETKPLGVAEIYVQGKGFVEGPKMTILHEGCPLSKAEFDALILGATRTRAQD